MKKLLILLFLFLVVSLCANFYFFSHPRPPEIDVIEDVIERDTVRDTVFVPQPAAKDSSLVRTESVRLPLSSRDSHLTISEVSDDSLHVCGTITAMLPTDSVDVEIPITQKMYEGEGYRAYVSGYNPSLDSLLLFREVEHVKIRSPTKPPRFSVGLQAGYGVTPKGFQPYIGVGITVNLWSH